MLNFGRPYNNLSIRTVSLTDVKDSPVGFNIGADATYLVVAIRGIGIGVGGLVYNLFAANRPATCHPW